MGCAGCEACGSGMYQVHVTLGKHPGSKMKQPWTADMRVHILCNLLPDGKWRKEWITTTNLQGSERDAVVHMKQVAKSALEAKVPVHRQKIEVPTKKLQGDRQVLYTEAHIKVILSLPNIDMAINEGRQVSVNVAKPGNMILTFRRKRYKDLVEAIKEAKLERYLGFDPERPIQYEAAIIDTAPELDDDWIPATWRTS
jgi:hypothetical protein